MFMLLIRTVIGTKLVPSIGQFSSFSTHYIQDAKLEQNSLTNKSFVKKTDRWNHSFSLRDERIIPLLLFLEKEAPPSTEIAY